MNLELVITVMAHKKTSDADFCLKQSPNNYLGPSKTRESRRRRLRRTLGQSVSYGFLERGQQRHRRRRR